MRNLWRPWLVCASVLFVVYAQDHSGNYNPSTKTRCYDDEGRPQRCIPQFENAAFNLRVNATNTCGDDGPSTFCVQTGTQFSRDRSSCSVCHAGDHRVEFLTDTHRPDGVWETWWQSETMLVGDLNINLTLNLNKAFDITYIRLVFHSPRPHSFAIYKRTSSNGTWIPYQYYSGSCRDQYSLPDSQNARRGEEARALCTSEYSDISPVTGGNIAFSTLEGRPSAHFFDSSPELQDWVTATDIMISLDRINTFGDEHFGDAQVYQSYFYAISDISIGARCKCNGHAEECDFLRRHDGTSERRCRCEHHTAGPDCGECAPFYNDVPWHRATSLDAHECRPCNCNNFSNRCFFDKNLYEQTGHGGHCLDCLGNRAGPNCERCKENFFQTDSGECIACHCHEIGSRSLQCNGLGQCQCKPGVTGDKCDRCEANHYDFNQHGCTPCLCSEAGSAFNRPNCDPYEGICSCKSNVEGRRCDTCKPGYFSLDKDNQYGCTPCFCYGHSSDCQAAPGFSKLDLTSSFVRGTEKWTAEDNRGEPADLKYDTLTQTISVTADGKQSVYFVAPERYLGDQRASYNQDLQFTLRISDNGPAPTVHDVVIEREDMSISQAIFGQGNDQPSDREQVYKFRLNENPDYGWNPRMSARDFMSILSNVTALKIRGTYTTGGIGFLDDVKLGSARRGVVGNSASWIELCNCQEGYVGQYCESCAAGFRHEPAYGGPFARCVPCNCNGHADICDSETGRCMCDHNTAGDNCDRCARGYYGNALQQTENDCKECPCPNRGACTQLLDETVVCLECPPGYAGVRCDLCSDGYFGDPNGQFGPTALCTPCSCNDNVDPNAVGNCNRTTGECLKCIYNTGGFECDQCLPGFYGDALSQKKGDCKQCQCYPSGTKETPSGPPVCDRFNGQCECKPNVIGTNCDTCEVGFYNINSNEGCHQCNCDPIGSLNTTCNLHTGQCFCREGVMGQHCDQCQPYHYGFSEKGCTPCDCDRIGSTSSQCDASGQCPCLNNVEGRRCDRCKENKYNRQEGCQDCPACYNLVQDAVNNHREKLDRLQNTLVDIANSPTATGDDDFYDQLIEVQESINKLHEDASAEDKSLLQRIGELRAQLQSVSGIILKVKGWTGQADNAIKQQEGNVSEAEVIVKRVVGQFERAKDYIQTVGEPALAKAMTLAQTHGQPDAQMTEIARQARDKAKEQETEAGKIKSVAENAKELSLKVYNLADVALRQQDETREELDKLLRDMPNLEQKLQSVKSSATRTSKVVDDVHKEGLTLYGDIFALPVPKITYAQIKTDGDIARTEAERMKEDALNLVSTNEALLNDLAKQMQQSEALLQTGESQRQKAEDLLLEVDNAFEQAKAAVKTGEHILEEAQSTSDTLKKFDNKVNESKEAAKKAAKERADIGKLVKEVLSKAQEAKLPLAEAVQNAQSARQYAQDAQQKFAEQASKEADAIRKGAEETKQSAEKLRDEAVLLAERVTVTSSRVKALEDQATMDEALTSSGKEKIGQAKSAVSDASKQVSGALEEVESIMREIREFSYTDEDTEALDKLESRLAAISEEFERAQLNEKIENLTLAKQSQNQWLKGYQEEVLRLEADVKNIQDIQAVLPKPCFNEYSLEP